MKSGMREVVLAVASGLLFGFSSVAEAQEPVVLSQDTDEICSLLVVDSVTDAKPRKPQKGTPEYYEYKVESY